MSSSEAAVGMKVSTQEALGASDMGSKAGDVGQKRSAEVSASGVEVYKKKQAVAPPGAAAAAMTEAATLFVKADAATSHVLDHKKRKAEEDELSKKKKKEHGPISSKATGAVSAGEDAGPSGGIKDSSLPSNSLVGGMSNQRVGGKVLPKDVAALQGLVKSASLKHGSTSTMRQIREQLISLGYSRDSVLEAKDVIKEAHAANGGIFPEGSKGDGIKEVDGERERASGAAASGQEKAKDIVVISCLSSQHPKPKLVEDIVAQAHGAGSIGKLKERTGRFTVEEDKLLLDAINAAIARVHSGDVDEFKATLCGPKARGDAGKKLLSEVWDDAFQALPLRSRTSCYDRGRRLLQDTRRGNWNENELQKIKDLVEKSGASINWQAIGQEVSRPASACKDIYRHRIQEKGNSSVEVSGQESAGTGRWSEEESKTMVQHVRQKLDEGTNERNISWIEVAKVIKTRSADQCRLHWRSVATGRGYLASKAGGEASQGGITGASKEWVWKRDRWTPEEDSELGKKVKEQVEARGLTSPSEIAWADIIVKNRLPHMSKERFRRRGEDHKDASLLERCDLLQSPPAKGKNKSNKKIKSKTGDDDDDDTGASTSLDSRVAMSSEASVVTASSLVSSHSPSVPTAVASLVEAVPSSS